MIICAGKKYDSDLKKLARFLLCIKCEHGGLQENTYGNVRKLCQTDSAVSAA